MNVNPRHFALKMLETAKEDLSRDRYLVPVAFIVTDDEIFDFNLKFHDREEKESVYRELVEIANEKSGKAIITINDANVTNPLGANAWPPSGHTKQTQECIYVAVSGPGIPTWTICAPYDRVGGEIIFGSQSETVGDVLNLLPGWP